MALYLPKSVVIRSSTTQQYLRYVEQPVASLGFVSTREEDIFNPLAKIDIEEATIDSRFVHLRFTHANRYWARRGPSVNDRWIVASADQPEEDRSKLTCTLFEPIAESNGTFSLRHVQSGLRVRADAGTAQQFVFVDFATANVNQMIFTFVDWDSLVKLPKHVAFKGHNDMYLQSVIRDSRFEYLEFSSDDGTEEATAHEITTVPDGHIRIMSLRTRRFWRLSPNWIWADSSSNNNSDINTLFWPVKLDDGTIALRNAANNRFCRSLTTEGKTNCFNASDTTISGRSRLKVEELVLNRHVFNVRYRMEDARIFDEKASVAGYGSAVNESDKEAELTIKVAYEDTSSFTFTNSLSIMAGVSVGITTGLPRIAEGKIEISTEVTNTFEWNRTTEETKTSESQYVVVVPPKSWVRVTFVSTRGTCSVPFSYTQRDKLARDGSFVTTQHADGLYTGVNYYSFHFEKQEIQPL